MCSYHSVCAMIGDHSGCHFLFAACVSETDCRHLSSVMCISGCELAVMCCNCVQRLCSCYNNIEICCVRGFTRFCVEEIRCRLVSWSERLEIDKVLHDKTGKPQVTSHSDAAIDNINSKLQPLASTDFFSLIVFSVY